MKHNTIAILLILLLTLTAPLSGLPAEGGLSNDLLDAVVPFEYGIDRFQQRIADSAGGEREPVGLLLSGGSARAFAHIGVIKALEELDISPDYIISNSMGSIVGILYAAGLNSAQIFEIVKNIDPATLFNLTYPFEGGLLDPSAFVSFVSSYLGETTELEDLPIPIIVITEDAKTKRQVLLGEGDIAAVLAASFALPVYFPPVEFRGHILVDGGITNLVPVEIATRFSKEVIVSTTFYEGKGINLKNPIGVLNVSMDIVKRRLGVSSLLQNPGVIWIRCDVEDFSFMDFDKVEELEREGYASAVSLSDQLKHLSRTGTGNGEPPQENSFEKINRELLDEYALFDIPRVSSSSHQVFTGMKNYPFGEGSSSYLRDEVLMGLRYTFTAPSVLATALGGFSWEPYTIGSVKAPQVLLEGRYMPLPSAMIRGSYQVAAGGTAVEQYASLSFTARQIALSRTLTVEEQVGFEGEFDSSFAVDESLVTAAASLSLEGDFNLTGSVAYQLYDDFSRHFLSTSLKSSFDLMKDVTLTSSIAARFALDGGGEVPYFSRDGYYTPSAVLLSQGRGGAANASAFLSVLSLDGIWAPRTFRPTVGEMLIFKDSGLGVFTQLLWFEDGNFIPDVCAGAQLRSSLSFIGLKEVSMHTFIGYDTLSSSLIGGISFGGDLL